MKNLSLFTHKTKPEYQKPFSLVDSQGDPWTVATDGASLFAIKGISRGPRFKGSVEALTTILQLLKAASEKSVRFERSTLNAPFEGSGKVLDVIIDLGRLKTLLGELPESPITMWNASDELGLPGLTLTCSDCLVTLMGCEVPPDEVIHEITFNPIVGSPLDAFLLD